MIPVIPLRKHWAISGEPDAWSSIKIAFGCVYRQTFYRNAELRKLNFLSPSIDKVIFVVVAHEESEANE